MKIDLSQKIAEHFDRLEALAIETESDESQSFSSRASAMTALSGMLVTLTKTQEEIVNMQRLQKIERVTIEVVKKYLNEKQTEDFLQELELMLGEEQ